MYLSVEASSTTMYVQNMIPHRIFGDKPPKKAFTSAKPELSHMMIFSFPLYIHVAKEKMMKMEPVITR